MNAQDRDVVMALTAEVRRIADALEASNEQHGAHDDPVVMERLLSVQERSVALSEQHNQLHMQQGLRPPERA
jgi:hypothetical protein